jgi:hypothetical protein
LTTCLSGKHCAEIVGSGSVTNMFIANVI